MQLSGVWPDGTVWEYQTINSEDEEAVYSAVFGIHFVADRILLTKNHRGWDIPGGGIEAGESPADALHREMYEECGFKVASCSPLGVLRLALPQGPMLVKGFSVTGSTDLDPVTATECVAAGYQAINSEVVTSAQKASLIRYLFKTKNKS